MGSGDDSSDGAVTVVGEPPSSVRGLSRHDPPSEELTVLPFTSGPGPVHVLHDDEDDDLAQHETRIRRETSPGAVREPSSLATDTRRCAVCAAEYPPDFLLCPRDGTPLPHAGVEPESPLVGTTLGETYRIVRRVGGGAMGDVFEARHLRLNQRKVAVKILRRELAFDPEMSARFQREAESASAISHPNVMDVFDVATLPDGTPYFVGEFVEGEDLETLLRREGKLEPSRAVHVLRQVCRALAAAHERGIVHRDVKPENVMVRRVPVIAGASLERLAVKVLDFGISKVRTPSELPHLTQVGMVLGTPAFMAPEQAAGRAVDARSDVYSAGALLYNALTGRPPFEGEDAATIIALVLKRQPTPVRELNPNVPEGLGRIVERAMARDASRRFPTMAELDRALAAYDAGAETNLPAAPKASPADVGAKRRLLGASAVLWTWLVLGSATALMALVTRVNHGDAGWLEGALVLAGCVIASAAPAASYWRYLSRAARTHGALAAGLTPVAATCVASYAALALGAGTAKSLHLVEPTFPSELWVLMGTLLATVAALVARFRRG